MVGSLVEPKSQGSIFDDERSCLQRARPQGPRVAINHFDRVYQGGITQEGLDTSKTKILKSLKMHLQTSEEWASYHLGYEVFGTGLTVSTRMNQLQAVTLKDLARIGKKYFFAR